MKTLTSLCLSFVSIAANACGSDHIETDIYVLQPHHLDNLAGVAELDYSLYIECPTCSSLEVLQSLRVIRGSLIIEGNDQLVSLAGLEGLGDVIGISIVYNSALVDTSQLDQIFPSSNVGSITVGSNDSLLELTGFGGITAASEVIISGNDKLVRIDAFANLVSIESDLQMLANPSLEHCADIKLRDQVGIENISGSFPTDCECPDGIWESIDGNCT